MWGIRRARPRGLRREINRERIKVSFQTERKTLFSSLIGFLQSIFIFQQKLSSVILFK